MRIRIVAAAAQTANPRRDAVAVIEKNDTALAGGSGSRTPRPTPAATVRSAACYL